MDAIPTVLGFSSLVCRLNRYLEILPFSTLLFHRQNLFMGKHGKQAVFLSPVTRNTKDKQKRDLSWCFHPVDKQRRRIRKFSELVCFYGFVLTARILIVEKSTVSYPLSTLSLPAFFILKGTEAEFWFFNNAINFFLLDLWLTMHRLLACITFSLIAPEMGSSGWVIFNNVAAVKC